MRDPFACAVLPLASNLFSVLVATKALPSLASVASRSAAAAAAHRRSAFVPQVRIRQSVVRRAAAATNFLPSEDPSEEDLSKWERMYEEGGNAAAKSYIFGDESPSSRMNDALTPSPSEIRVVTFDLDNTLWKTSEVISKANEALNDHLDDMGINQPTRVDKMMKKLFNRDKAKYCPDLSTIEGSRGESPEDVARKASNAKAPVLLTKLRTDAVREILVRDNDYGPDDADAIAADAFRVWTTARHEAIPRHYANSVVECLEVVRSMKTSEGHPVVVGAITDGNSDPRNVPDGLGRYFDFCVNSEGVGVSKPDRRVYEAAVTAVARGYPAVGHLFDGLDLDGGLKDDVVDDLVGPWWVHVGDDFIKDVVAAKELKMRSVWARELVKKPKEEEGVGGSKRAGDGPDAAPNGAVPNGAKNAESPEKKKKRDVGDLVKELSEMKVVQMSIGAEDFLLDSIEREFADAIVDEFRDVSDLLRGWHEEAIRAKEEEEVSAKVATPGQMADAGGTSSVSIEAGDAVDDILTVIPPDRRKDTEPASPTEVDLAAPESTTAPTAPPSTFDGSTAAETKFCLFCGTKLPAVARFCSACGKKQI